MRRRSFLRAMLAAGAVPLAPARAVAAVARPTPSLYSLAVFHARTRVGLTAADLATRLRVSTATADALMARLSAGGLIAPAFSAATQALRGTAASGSNLPKNAPGALRDLAETGLRRAADNEPGTAPDPEQETDDGQV